MLFLWPRYAGFCNAFAQLGAMQILFRRRSPTWCFAPPVSLHLRAVHFGLIILAQVRDDPFARLLAVFEPCALGAA